MQMFAKNGLTTLQLCSLQRFAKRRSAFRPSPFFLANSRLSITSSIERIGCCWLPKPGFGSWQGQFQGQFFGRSPLLRLP
jgi:hypothetical protein